MTYSTTASHTYEITDIEVVIRRFTADLVMIAQSSASMSEAEARSYAHDVELLAKSGYLRRVDLTLLGSGVEVKATQYTVNTSAGDLSMSRPGGLLWPRVANPHLRIVLSYTPAYDDTARAAMREKLKISWVPTSVDTNHWTLAPSGGRNYASNGWGMQRADFS